MPLTPRFANDFQLVGSVSVTPSTELATVGSFTLGQGEDTLFVGIEQTSPADPNVFAYGILGFRGANGYELGTQKAFFRPELTVSRLSVGLAPADQSGVLTFEPRPFNLRWVAAGNALSLRFYARGGTSGGAGSAVVSNSFVNRSDGGGLRLVQVDFAGRA